jgi:hypothetical protein
MKLRTEQYGTATPQPSCGGKGLQYGGVRDKKKGRPPHFDAVANYIGKHTFYNYKLWCLCKVTGSTFRPQRYRTVRETRDPSPYSSNIKKSWRFTAMPPLRPRPAYGQFYFVFMKGSGAW